MLYYENLEELIFHRHQMHQTDELIILSGYIGPSPVDRLQHLPFPTKVIYGMFPTDGISSRLHDSLTSIQNSIDNIDIYYSTVPIHSKCYAWKRDGSIIHALVGSANFSSNGLRTPYREILAEATYDTFAPLNTYINTVLNAATLCLNSSATASRSTTTTRTLPTRTTAYCRMTLLDPARNETHNAHGLNWGQNPKNHTHPDDANIPIRAEHIRMYPELFPQKQDFSSVTTGGRNSRHNDAIEILWDDGTTMEGLLEGNGKVSDFPGIKFPKQISSFPDKKDLGLYIKRRLGLNPGQRVSKNDLDRYGRTHIDVSLLGEGIYYFDFSVPPANGE